MGGGGGGGGCVYIIITIVYIWNTMYFKYTFYYNIVYI